MRHTPEARKARMRRKHLVILVIYPASFPPLPLRLNNAPTGRRRLGIPIIRDRLVPRIGEGVEVVLERCETDNVEREAVEAVEDVDEERGVGGVAGGGGMRLEVVGPLLSQLLRRPLVPSVPTDQQAPPTCSPFSQNVGIIPRIFPRENKG